MRLLAKPVLKILLLAALLLPVLSLTPQLTEIAEAAPPPSCTYTYNADKTEIVRSSCTILSSFNAVGATLKQNGTDGKTYVANLEASSGNTCTVTVKTDSPGSSSATMSGTWPQSIGSVTLCTGFDSTKITIEGGDSTGSTGGTGSGEADVTGSGETGDLDPCSFGDGGLAWIVCPLIDTINSGVRAMQAVIDHLMRVDLTEVFDRSQPSGEAYYQVWNSFRIFAVLIVIAAGLIMVISQAFGFEILDAYTVKKVLPRIFIAAIGISLSWYLLEYLAAITNDLGLAIRSIIYYPFRDLGAAGLQDTGGYLLTLLGAGAGLFALQIGGALSLVATAGLAALIAFLVLILRQLIMIFLILIAPLAIALYILPNTQKAYNLWWDSLFKGLLMFPIISGFIALGHVFSVVASNSTGGAGSSVNQVVALIAFFLPYFVLPFTFRLAGGAIATIGGLTNDQGRGAFDRLKKYRAGKVADSWTRAQNEKRWDPNFKVGGVAVGKYANKAATWATDPLNNFAYSNRDNAVGRAALLRKRGLNVASRIQEQQVEQTRKEAEFQNNVFGNNDKAYRVLNGGLHGGLSAQTQQRLKDAKLFGKNIENMDQFNEVASILSQSDEQTERLAANAMIGYRGRAASLYKDPEAARASIAGAAMMGLAQHGFLNPDDLPKAVTALASNADGTIDRDSAPFAQVIGNQAQLIGARSRPDIKNGYALEWDSASNKWVSGLAETYDVKDASGRVVGTETRNDSLRALDELATMTADDIMGAKSGIYKTGTKGAGDAMRFVLREGGSDPAKTALAEYTAMSDAERAAFDASTKKRGPDRTASDKANYEKMKLIAAAKQHDSFVRKMDQIVGAYSRGATDNTTEAVSLLTSLSTGGSGGGPVKAAGEILKRRDRQAEINPSLLGAQDQGGGDTGIGGQPPITPPKI